MSKSIIRIAAFAMAASLSSIAAAGTLVVSGDEWQLSDSAYDPDYVAGTTAFVNSLATTFGGTNYLLLTGNVGIPQASLSKLAAQFTSLGKTVSYSATFDLATASGYDAVFHVGQYVASPADFAAYVNGGGGAYISLGSGQYGNPVSEAAHWNPMLAQFGLIAGNSWFTDPGFVKATVVEGPTTSLLWGYGQTIEKLTPESSSVSYIRATFAGSQQVRGLVGASIAPKPPIVPGVPEPASWAMMIAGFGLVGAISRRRRSVFSPA
ncbi:PEPxxWA-CTERM sorting domain-containing protein [Sandaracinobacter neustonicus]|uniref:PEPxxWA-CTERM sorting domain-containing protein n=1 Tax=Sandaracinobacter neustonicus TaxID=1715348 RepID=UPI001F3CDB90|nr:PEPxxWA-CTERM sorting domain-containing protein [Sandaracinobacter neustonicus]